MFIHWFLRCQCLLLSCLTCLTMSNLLWFMDLTFQVPRQYYSYSVGLYFHHQTPPQTEHHFDQAFSFFLAAAAAKSHQSCLTLCDPIDGSPPDSPIPGILQARTLECVAISFSNAWKWKVKTKLLSLSGTISNCSQLFLSSVLHIFWPGGSSSNLLPLHTLQCILVARILKWFAICSSSGPCFVRTLHYGLSILHSLA